MIKTKTETNTATYTKSRINVIEDHFELFLRCSEMEDERVKKLLLAVERHQLEAVAIYIIENGYRIAEVRFEIDWEKHIELTHVYGDLFEVDLPGWRDGVSPEAYVVVSRLVKAAKEQNLEIYSYIVVSNSIRENKKEHKKVCDELGYCFEGSVPQWKGKTQEHIRPIEGLPEAKVISKQVF